MEGIKVFSPEALNLLLKRNFADIPGCLSLRGGDVHSVNLNTDELKNLIINGKDYASAVRGLILFWKEGLLEIYYLDLACGYSATEHLPLDGIYQFAIVKKIKPPQTDHHGNEED